MHFLLLQQDLADRRMANLEDPVLSHHTSQEKQPAAVPELPNNKPHQSPKQSHAEDHKRRGSSVKNRQASEQKGAPQSRSSTYEPSVRNISSTSKTPFYVFIDFKKAFDRFGMQLCGQPLRSTTSAQTLSKSSKTSITRPIVPSSSTAA